MLEIRRTGRRRAVHLIDVENLLGGADFTPSQAEFVCQRYMHIAPVSPDDHFVVASSHRAARSTWFGWRPARRLVRSGPDGADAALLDVAARERLHERFDHAVIGSGDGIFAEACAWLQAQGCAVTVITRCPSALSRRLRLASLDVRFLEPSAVPAAGLRRVA